MGGSVGSTWGCLGFYGGSVGSTWGCLGFYVGLYRVRALPALQGYRGCMRVAIGA